MKSIWLHIIYLSVIGVLGFQLWVKTATTNTAVTYVNDTYNETSIAMKNENQYIFEILVKQYMTNPKYDPLLESAKNVKTITKSTLDSIVKGNADLHLYKKINILQFRNNLKQIPSQLMKGIDSFDRELLLKNSQINKIINDQTFWNIFSSKPQTLLQIIENKILLDEKMCFNYLIDKVSSRLDFHPPINFKLVISPKNIATVEGDTTIAEIFLAGYSLRDNNPGVIFIIDGQKTTTQFGIVNYSQKIKTIGNKKLKAVASIRNPVTGEYYTINNELNYKVLPKCSENCQ